jgi:hypothetical protein
MGYEGHNLDSRPVTENTGGTLWIYPCVSNYLGLKFHTDVSLFSLYETPEPVDLSEYMGYYKANADPKQFIKEMDGRYTPANISPLLKIDWRRFNLIHNKIMTVFNKTVHISLVFKTKQMVSKGSKIIQFPSVYGPEYDFALFIKDAAGPSYPAVVTKDGVVAEVPIPAGRLLSVETVYHSGKH